MKNLVTTFNFLLLPFFVFCTDIPITWNYNGGNLSNAIPIKVQPVDKILLTVTNLSSVIDFDDFVKNSSIKVNSGTAIVLEDFLKTQQADGFAIFRNSHTLNALDLTLALTAPLNENDILELNFKDKSGIQKFTIPVAGDGGETNTRTESGVNTENLENWIGDRIIKIGTKEISLLSIYQNEERYEKSRDKAYLIVDENGNLIGGSPVNIDQDDKIVVIMIGKKSEIIKCKVDYIGTYSPVDLQMRSFEPLSPGFTQNALIGFDIMVFPAPSPFTSESVIIKIKKGNNVISTYTLRVNKLFHLGFGISFNRTALENPEFEITPLSNNMNTISKVNGGNRNILSFNAIWYWSSTIRYLLRGSNITRGRDVLKEPNFLERINPTFGITLSGTITDNIFVGASFEFARGGTLVGGYHFGKVKKLAIPDFEVGTTVFTGTADDITTSMESDKGLYFGLMLDTRIFNNLFRSRQ